MTQSASFKEFMRRIHKVHFVGIGGAGMSGIADVMNTLGYEVSGSDLASNAVIDELKSSGVKIFPSHSVANVIDVDVVVTSTAIDSDNVEVVAAKENHIPVVPRAEMLAELMRFSHGIAVAGTHGKTTTTSLVTSVLAEAGLDPTYVIGGKLNSSAKHARLGKGKYMVAEADESDASFLYLQPMMSIVTNIDADHLSTYGGDFARLKKTFVEFLHHLPFYGLAVVCVDDEEVRSILPEVSRPIIRYGIDFDADVSASNIRYQGSKSVFDVQLPDTEESFEVTLNMPGRHNILNALAAICVAYELGVSSEDMQKALLGFEGIGRRMHLYGEASMAQGTVSIVDDYAHHPTEIAATLHAAKNSWPDKRLVAVFQPHRYSRTRDLFEDFSQILSDCDVLVLTEVYSAGEQPIAVADGRALCAAIRARGKVNPVFVEEVENLGKELKALLQDGDLVLTMGAGSIGRVASQLRQSLEAEVGGSDKRTSE